MPNIPYCRTLFAGHWSPRGDSQGDPITSPKSRKEKILDVFGGIVCFIFIYLVALLVKYGDAYRLLETLK